MFNVFRQCAMMSPLVPPMLATIQFVFHFSPFGLDQYLYKNKNSYKQQKASCWQVMLQITIFLFFPFFIIGYFAVHITAFFCLISMCHLHDCFACLTASKKHLLWERPEPPYFFSAIFFGLALILFNINAHCNRRWWPIIDAKPEASSSSPTPEKHQQLLFRLSLFFYFPNFVFAFRLI